MIGWEIEVSNGILVYNRVYLDDSGLDAMTDQSRWCGTDAEATESIKELLTRDNRAATLTSLKLAPHHLASGTL